MNDRFCANFLTYKGKISTLIDVLDLLFYATNCNSFFALIVLALSVGGIFALLYFTAHSFFIKLAKIPLFFILTTLFLISLIALFKDFSSSVAPKDSLFLETLNLWLKKEFFALAMQEYSFYTRNLFAVFLITIMLFFATRLILGRQAQLKGDFWEHQKIAKSKVAWLNALFFVMIILICVCAFSLFQMIFLSSETNYDDIEAFIYERASHLRASLTLSVIFALLMWFAYLYKSFMMRNCGISKLASILNADEIVPSGKVKERRENKKGKYFLGHRFAGKFMIREIKRPMRDSKAQIAKNKMLFNVISEMAIASNMPVPRVFVMQNELGINALCSGERFGYADEKNAIFVTQGALNHLSREELQGVVAHEFSHAFHGDVALNLKIYSLIFALTWIMMIGETFLRHSGRAMHSRGSGSANIGIVLANSLIAFVFYALGFLGSIFAKILQSAISRQKEFLADASSVQYTRNVSGIKSALKRIRDLQNSADFGARNIGAVGNISAEPCAHMFFLDAVDRFFDKLFATHPSLEKRIRALDKIG